MDIRSKNNLFLIVTLLVALFTISFGVYEYRREHAFRVDILHSQLQLNNYRTLSPTLHYEGKEEIDTTFRITIIDTEGNVLYDSQEKDVKKMGNHLHRKEIQDALLNGSGYDIKRASETNGEKYFYSATYFDHLPFENMQGGGFIRSSVPYSAPLTSSLERDYTFFYYTAGILALIAVVLYLRLRLHRSEEDKQRIKRQLTENAAHELKTPAAAIEGYLETMIDICEKQKNNDIDGNQCSLPITDFCPRCSGDRGGAEEGRGEGLFLSFLSRCYAQSQRMSRLLQDMSMLTRLDEAAIVRPSTAIDAGEIIQGIIDETSAHFAEHNIALDHTALPANMPMQGDSALIYSLFRNIFDNALAYATGATRFTVSASTSSSDYVFTFRDNGVGVPTEHLPHLFERFYRVDKGRSRKLGGTGLGLAIVKNIAIQYGGSAVAEETEGGGLTIIITLSINPASRSGVL